MVRDKAAERREKDTSRQGDSKKNRQTDREVEKIYIYIYRERERDSVGQRNRGIEG